MQVATVHLQARTVAAAIALVLFGHATVAAEFVPNEASVSPQRDILDPEFDQASGLMAWTDISGDLWVAQVDRTNGNLIPASGKGVLVDRQTATMFDPDPIFTGPEWVWRAGGNAIVYTRYPVGKEHVRANARIGFATRNADGTWTRTMLSTSAPRNSPLGSETVGDSAPRVNYYDTQGYQYWREIARPETEQMLPAMDVASREAARAVRGARAMTYLAPVAGVMQVFRYDLDTHVLEQLTTDAGAKSAPRMWQAPEFGNAFVFATVVDRATLRFYREQPGGGWSPFLVHTDPTVGTLASIEPFVYNGRSYVVMHNTESASALPTSIWVAGMDVANPVFRRITPLTPTRLRTDPEVFVTDQGPVVYFSRFDPSMGPPAYCLKCSEGLHRANPGLAP